MDTRDPNTRPSGNDFMLKESGEVIPRSGTRLSRRAFLGAGGLVLAGLAGIRAWNRFFGTYPAGALPGGGVPTSLEGALSQGAIGAGAAAAGEAAGAGGASIWRWPGMPLEVTPVGRFYTISKNLWDPTVDARRWTLRVEGRVQRPITLDYAQLTSGGPTYEQYVTLTCISNTVGGDLAGNALWKGIRLRDLLQDAGVQEDAVDVVLEGEDDYTDSIPIEKAMHPDTLLAWEMNGAPLLPKHGFPARLIVPGIYGMKNVKWIRRIEVVNFDYQGFWARRGWSDVATIKTWSRIDAPSYSRLSVGDEWVVGGVAYAGDRGISRVEVSFDNGASWVEAQLKEALSPLSWRLWALPWRPTASGGVAVTVRAYDGAGRVQSSRRVDPLPDGAEGYHTARFQVW